MRHLVKAIVFCLVGLPFLGQTPAGHPQVHALASYRIADACPGVNTMAGLYTHKGALVLHVTFQGVTPGATAVDTACRAYLAQASRVFPQQDIAVRAWVRPVVQRSPLKDSLIFPYGQNEVLRYTAQTKTVSVQN